MKTTKIVLFCLFAFLVIAAIKNPSTSEAKQIVKDYTVEKVNQKIYENMNDNDEEDSAAQFGQILGSMFVSKIVENVIDVNVTDYIAFSTFNITAFGNRNIASGIILFGNVIPLSSDLKKENFQEQ